MILALLLALQAQDAAPPPESYRPAPATIVAEPIAVFLAGMDRDRDGRTTRAELRDGLAEILRASAGWNSGVGHIGYADWAKRWLGDANAVPTAFEIDRNGDNRVTATELTDRMEAIFTRFDIDKDDGLSRAELLTVRGSPLGRPGGENGRRPRRR